jgi:tRNA threonylcarbamoyladenosine biosynthesis protein TsaB
MKILAVDTSTASGSVALLDGQELRFEYNLQSAKTHNRRLLNSVDALLGELSLTIEDMDGFAVTIGPGSFTGIRIGISTMKTLAWVLGKPYAGIPTLDALAAPLQFASLPVCTLLDARKQEVYAALFQPDGTGSCQRVSPYQVISPQQVPSQIKGPTLFCGDGWLLYRELFLMELGSWAIELPSPYHFIRASFVAELARVRLREGKADDPMISVPIYIRPSEAEIHYSDVKPFSGA